MTENSAAGNRRISLLGVPFDANSSFMRGPASAPAAVRRVMGSGASNMTAENGFVLDAAHDWSDAGDVPCINRSANGSKNSSESGAEDFKTITRQVTALLQSGERVLSLGGDHSISYPILQAYARVFARSGQGLTVLHLDAHPDLYDELDGNRHSHASPFARIMEDRLAKHLVQVGIRTMNAHQKEQAERFRVEVHEANHWRPTTTLGIAGPLYLSIDIDVLDPAFAPGVSHHEPGGLSVRDVLSIIRSIDVPLVGADIVEYNPSRDINDMTAAVCAKLIKEVSAKMADSRHRAQ